MKGQLMETFITMTVGVLLPLLTIIHQANTNFTTFPLPQVVGVGEVAVFKCRHPITTFISWRVNKTTMVMEGVQGPSGITAGRIMDGNGIVAAFTLTIVAQSNYNETEVVCIATFVGNIPDEETTSVNLTIQGTLSMVMGIKRNSSTITWVPPFSLNLTDVDPDIVYCVEVYNITCGMDDLVVSDCNVTESHYVDNRLQQGHIYHITITPRSNGLSTTNGTNNNKKEMFISLTDLKIVSIRGSTMDYVSVQLKHDINDSGIEPDSYSLSLSPIDGVEAPPNDVIPTNLIHSADVAVTLNVTQPFPHRRLWNYRVLALGCSEHPVTNLLELSTHDFQNVCINSSTPGEISVIGNFIDGSAANSILVIVYSDSHSSYMFSPPSNEEEKLVTRVTGLPSGQYNVSVFVVEENGLPFERSVTTPRNVSVVEGGESDNNFQIEYELHRNSTHVCITCIFPSDSSATDCVAVVHQRISQLSSSGLMYIESSRKFNKSGNTAYGCILGVDYQVGVVGGRLIETPPQPDSGVEVFVAITVGILVPAVGVSVIVVVIWKKKKNRSGQVVNGKSGDSSSIRPLTTKGEAHLQDETVYAVLHRRQSQPAEVEGGHLPVPTSIYSILGQNQLDLDPSSTNVEDLAYATVGPSSVSREMVPQDFDHTVVEYSEVQQEAQEEESFTKGVGDAGDRICDDDGIGDQELATYQSVAVNVFHSIQDPVVASELISLTRKEVNQQTTVVTAVTGATAPASERM